MFPAPLMAEPFDHTISGVPCAVFSYSSDRHPTVPLTTQQPLSPPHSTAHIATVPLSTVPHPSASYRFSPLLTASHCFSPHNASWSSNPGRQPSRREVSPAQGLTGASSCQEGGGRVAVPPGVFSASGLAPAPAPISGRRRQPAPLGRNVRRAASAPLLTGLAHRVPCLAGTPPRRSPGAAERPEKWCCRGCAAAGCCRTSGGR